MQSVAGLRVLKLVRLLFVRVTVCALLSSGGGGLELLARDHQSGEPFDALELRKEPDTEGGRGSR